MISTVDPEARHTRKSPSNRRDSYRAHLVAEPETGLITDEQLTAAAGPANADAAVAQQFLAHTDPEHHAPAQVVTCDEPADGSTDDTATDDTADDDTARARGGEELAWYGDSAYGTGEFREAIERAGHRAVIKPKPVAPAVEGSPATTSPSTSGPAPSPVPPGRPGH